VPVIVDGYNLLYARGEAPSPATRARLVQDLIAWAEARGRRTTVVFDAWAGGERTEREERHGPVTVCYTRYGERADQHIVRWVSARPEAVVVTSDRAVRQAVRRRGAAVLDSAAFARRLEAVRTPHEVESRDEDDAEATGERPARRHRGRQESWLRGL